MADEDLVGSEGMTVGQAGRPLPGRGLRQLTGHAYKPRATLPATPGDNYSRCAATSFLCLEFPM